MTDGRPASRDPAGALVRLLGALVELGDRPVGVRELARALGLTPSTVQRTLESARRASLVTTTRDGKWSVGWEMYRLAAFVGRRDPFVVCHDDLAELAEDLGETVVLTVLDQEKCQRMFVAAAQSPRPVRFVPPLYTWLPALAGATGLAIAAGLAPEDRRRLHAAVPAATLPERVRTEEDFERTCAGIRRAGYATSEDEVELGASSVAAPVPAPTITGCALGAIVPRQRFTAPDERTLRRLDGAVTAVATRLGGGTPPAGGA